MDIEGVAEDAGLDALAKPVLVDRDTAEVGADEGGVEGEGAVNQWDTVMQDTILFGLLLRFSAKDKLLLFFGNYLYFLSQFFFSFQDQMLS